MAHSAGWQQSLQLSSTQHNPWTIRALCCSDTQSWLCVVLRIAIYVCNPATLC
jgi:hypothetical protein